MKIRTDHRYLLSKFAKEMIEGGLADGKSPKVSEKERKMGDKVEMEHTKNPKEAKEIRKDHHVEDKKYYTKLDKMEDPPKKNKEQKVLVDYLRKNPNPKDEEEVHELADKKGLDKHKLEEGAYSLLAEYTNTFDNKKVEKTATCNSKKKNLSIPPQFRSSFDKATNRD